MWNRRLRLFTGHGGALKFQDQPCPIPRPGPAPVSRNSRSRQLQLPDRFDLRSPDLTVSRANRTPRYVPRRGNRGCQRCGAKGRAGLVESQIQTRHGNGFNPIFLNQVSGFNRADGRYIDRLAVGRGSVERVRSANRQPRVVRKVPKDCMSVRYDRTRSKNARAGNCPTSLYGPLRYLPRRERYSGPSTARACSSADASSSCRGNRRNRELPAAVPAAVPAPPQQSLVR